MARPTLILVLFASATTTLHLVAQTPPHPVLLADSAPPTTPDGWRITGRDPFDYQLALDTTVTALLLGPRPTATATTWAAARQVISAHAYRGHRIMFTAECRFQDVILGGLFVRVDGLIFGDPGELVFDNMENRAFVGTQAWHEYRIVLDVPPNAEYILLGAHVQGQGRIWLRNARVVADPPPWFTPTVKGGFARLYEAGDVPAYRALAEQAISAPALMPQRAP